LYWVAGHAGEGGNKIALKLARDGSVLKFVGPETVLGAQEENKKEN
jgi:ribonuclease HI